MLANSYGDDIRHMYGHVATVKSLQLALFWLIESSAQFAEHGHAFQLVDRLQNCDLSVLDVHADVTQVTG